MQDIKKLRQALLEKQVAGRAKTSEYNALAAKADRSEVEDARVVALNGELDALAADVETLEATIKSEEAAAKRAASFAPVAVAPRNAFSAGRVNDPDPVMQGGFKSLAEFASVVRSTASGIFDDRLNAAGSTVYNTNNGASGEGFLVPPEYSKTIWNIAFTDLDLVGLAKPEPTSSNAVLRPKDESTPWGAVGVQAYWRNEASTMTPTKYAVTGELMTLHELYAFTAATNELLSDAPMLENRLSFQAGRAIAWKSSEAIMWGNGAGQPLGFMNATSLITVAKDSGQATKTITVSNLGNMLARMLAYGGKPFWIANRDTIPALMQCQLGSYAAFLPINQPLANSPFEYTLLGFPVLFSEHAQTLGTPGDLVLANMDGYYAAVKAGGESYATSMHLYFDTNETAFRWTMRLAGIPTLSAAISPAKGSTTKSHFIALAAR
jgi:hypothetical protein